MKSTGVLPHAAPVIRLWKEAGREMSFTISGISMEPVLKTGDRVTVRPVHPEEMKRGDIIAFSREGQVIVHRLVGRGTMDGAVVYYQKGDNLDGLGRIPEESIIGKVVSVKGARYVAEMDDPPWRWLNPALGLWGAGWVAFENILGTIWKSAAGDSRGALVSGSKKALRDARLFLPHFLLRLLLTRPARRGG